LGGSFPFRNCGGSWDNGEIAILHLIILNNNWHFAQQPGGHYYLGHCLAGLNPNSPDIAVLAPHFTIGNPMENLQIQEATLMYGPALKKCGGTKDSDPIALLLCV
jgi:hypothetical protein